MTSALVWKCIEVSNRYYSSILRYYPCGYIDSQLEQIVLTLKPRHFLPFSLYVLSMSCSWLFCATLILEMSVFRTIPFSVLDCTAQIFILGIISAHGIAGLFILPHIKLIAYQYFNTLFGFERKLLNRKSFCVSKTSIWFLLKAGN